MNNVIEAARKLAEVRSHRLTCRFTGCTCEAAVDQVEALNNFWRQYRLWKEYNG
jgi:hypothetical protein